MLQKSILLIGAFLFASIPARAQNHQRLLPDGPGKETVQSACTSCHELSMVTNAGHGAPIGIPWCT